MNLTNEQLIESIDYKDNGKYKNCIKLCNYYIDDLGKDIDQYIWRITLYYDRGLAITLLLYTQKEYYKYLLMYNNGYNNYAEFSKYMDTKPNSDISIEGGIMREDILLLEYKNNLIDKDKYIEAYIEQVSKLAYKIKMNIGDSEWISKERFKKDYTIIEKL